MDIKSKLVSWCTSPLDETFTRRDYEMCLCTLTTTEPLFCEHQETKESVLNRGISCAVCQTTSVHCQACCSYVATPNNQQEVLIKLML